jgi:hypothetical protein
MASGSHTGRGSGAARSNVRGASALDPPLDEEIKGPTLLARYSQRTSVIAEWALGDPVRGLYFAAIGAICAGIRHADVILFLSGGDPPRIARLFSDHG